MKVLQTESSLRFKCPACGEHTVPVPRWQLSGSVESPTIRPSLVETVNPPGPDHRPHIPTTVCHSLVTNGKIEFLADCTHNLAGQTLELSEFILPETLS
jgi:hypothetical protein